jgi:hypothetical protein
MREAGWYLFLVEASHRDEATMGDDTSGNHAISKEAVFSGRNYCATS